MKMSPQQILITGFTGVILLGGILLALPVSSAAGKFTNFIDALFTATSAVCVTGLIVVNTATHWSLFGKIVICLLIQIGGLGYMTMATLLVIIVGRQITLQDRMAFSEGLQIFSFANIKEFILYVVKITLLIELAGAVILSTKWVPEFGFINGFGIAIFHAVSAFCNAGLSVFDTNLMNYAGSVTVNFAITSLIILGGIGYVVMSDLVHYKKTHRLFLHTKVALLTTLILLVVGAFLIFVLEYNNPLTIGTLSLKDKILVSYFQSVSPRTAGFNTTDISAFTYPVLFIIVMLMFIGASPSGTGGGIKTTTAATVYATIRAFFKSKKDVTIFKSTVSHDTVMKSLILTLAAVSFILFVTFLLLISEKREFLRTLFEVVSAFATCGLSAAPGTPLSLSAFFSEYGKMMIIITMFVGRLGPLTIAAAILQESNSAKYRYAEDKIIIG